MRSVALWVGAFVLAVATAPLLAQSSQDARAAQAAARSAAAADRAAAAAARSNQGVRYYGPADTGNTYQPRPQSIGEAPPQLKYMSPRCSGLNDALRTASARGLNYDTIGKMRKDYQAECGEDEREAHGKLSEEARDKSLQKRDAKMAEARERERTAVQQEQCGESKRILRNKRARTDLTEGEKAELERFEANYKARCG